MTILTKAQAEAIYRAMCELNNVSGKIKAMLGDVSTEGINVFESAGEIHVAFVRTYDVLDSEIYSGQVAFAAAYGLDGKQPRKAVYTPGIGWQVQDHLGRRGNYETEAQALGA